MVMAMAMAEGVCAPASRLARKRTYVSAKPVRSQLPVLPNATPENEGRELTASLVTSAALLGALFIAVPASAEWRPGNPDVAIAAGDARIANALAAVNTIDQAAVSGGPTAFAALLADDLAVNNPQNGVSLRGATARRSAAGAISYSRYDRVIEYAGLRGDMVLLMGEEIVQPRGGGKATEVHRRFTDLWKQVDGAWKLTARQATIITRP